MPSKSICRTVRKNKLKAKTTPVDKRAKRQRLKFKGQTKGKHKGIQNNIYTGKMTKIVHRSAGHLKGTRYFSFQLVRNNRAQAATNLA